MSTTTTSSDSTSSSNPSNNAPPGPSNQGNLYLFTFLATLLVLLLISCSIVFRSFVLRRRYQRRLHEALAVGAVLAPGTQGSRRTRFRTRPKFFDAYLATGGDTWEEIMPVSVLPVKTKKRSKEIVQPTETVPTRDQSVLQKLFRTHFILPPRSSMTDESLPPSPATPLSPILGKPESHLTALQVAVLVAMPSPRHRSSTPSDNDEEEVPDVAIGVTRLGCNTKPASPTN